MVTWSSNHDDQQTIISRIEGKLDTLRTRTKPATLYSTSTPTANQLNAAWGNTYSPQTYESVQWLDTANNVLRNQYARINDNTTSSSSGTFRPYSLYPSGNIPFTFMSEQNVDANPSGTTISVSVTSQSFRHLCLFFQLRDTVASINATHGFRINGLSAANYGASWQGANSTFGLGTEQNSLTSWQIFVPAANAARSYYAQGFLWLFNYATTTRMPQMHLRATSLWGNPYTTSTTTNYNMFGIYNTGTGTGVAVTQLNVVTGNAFAQGSRLVLFGV